MWSGRRSAQQVSKTGPGEKIGGDVKEGADRTMGTIVEIKRGRNRRASLKKPFIVHMLANKPIRIPFSRSARFAKFREGAPGGRSTEAEKAVSRPFGS